MGRKSTRLTQVLEGLWCGLHEPDSYHLRTKCFVIQLQYQMVAAAEGLSK